LHSAFVIFAIFCEIFICAYLRPSAVGLTWVLGLSRLFPFSLFRKTPTGRGANSVSFPFGLL
jgi:hypothetical protein